MTKVCHRGTYFGAQHILDPANNSSWVWHTVAAMLAIWDYPKSWAHLATLSVGLPMDRVWNGGSDLQAGMEIHYWEHPQILAHFEQPK